MIIISIANSHLTQKLKDVINDHLLHHLNSKSVYNHVRQATNKNYLCKDDTQHCSTMNTQVYALNQKSRVECVILL